MWVFVLVFSIVDCRFSSQYVSVPFVFSFLGVSKKEHKNVGFKNARLKNAIEKITKVKNHTPEQLNILTFELLSAFIRMNWYYSFL